MNGTWDKIYGKMNFQGLIIHRAKRGNSKTMV